MGSSGFLHDNVQALNRRVINIINIEEMIQKNSASSTDDSNPDPSILYCARQES